MGSIEKKLRVLALGAALVPAACHGPSILYDASNPAVVRGCPDATATADLPTRTYAAMLKALAERRWTFDHIRPDQGTLVATACFKNTNCVTMIFQVAQDGSITVTRDPNKLVMDNMDGHMIGWLRFFEQKFSLYRCMSTDLALEELKKFGAIQTSAPPPAAPPPPAPTPAPAAPAPAAAPASVPAPAPTAP
jgi:hypothetical protein